MLVKKNNGKLIILVLTLFLFFVCSVGAVSAANVYNITNESYSNYFDEIGYINDTSIQSGDVLDYSGTIIGKDMYIDRPLNLTSSDKTGTLLNGTITILQEGSGTNITNLVINNTNHNGAVSDGSVVLYGTQNCTVANNVIITNQNSQSYGVHLVNSVNNQFLDNTILTTGAGTGKSRGFNHGVYLENSSFNLFNSNTINTTGASADVDWTAYPEPGVYPTIGLFIANGSNNNTLTGNTINTNYGLIYGDYDTLLGVRIMKSSGNNLTGNNITTTGYSYAYGLDIGGTSSVPATGNVVSNNNISTVGIRDDETKSYANGLHVSSFAVNTVVTDNNISAVAPHFSYPVYLENFGYTGVIELGPSLVTGNTVYGAAHIVYVLELWFACYQTITGNVITGVGNYSMGIGTYASCYNNITNNNITTIGNNSASMGSNVDAIPASNEGVKLYSSSNNNLVDSNRINSADVYAVNVGDVGGYCYNNNITNNFLYSDNGTKQGDSAVTGSGNISGNYGLPPVTNFTATPVTGNSPLTVQFNDTSSNNPTGWAWDFDNDGIVDSTLQNPTWTYNTASNYTVKLTTTNAMGSDDEVKTDFIIVNMLPGPVADFTATPVSGYAPLTVQFNETSLNNPTSWAWDFDNDSVIDSTLQNPTWTYSTAGNYSVKLTATNSVGSDDEVKTGYIMVNVDPLPVANFTATPVSGYAPLTVQFNDTSSNSPKLWAWDFTNDGMWDSTLQNPTWTYNTPGNYTVKLTVFNLDGSDEEVKTNYITVNEVVTPVADFTASPVNGVNPLTVQFTDTSSNDPTSWSWDFDNDGVIDSTLQNPTWTYSAVGNYTVKLTATNIAGSDDEVKTGYVNVLLAGLADTSWPKFGGDINNTGLSDYVGPQNNIILWSYTTGASISYAGPSIASDGTIYIGSGDGNVYALNPNGTVKWTYHTGSAIYGSPAIGTDGTIYVGSLDNNVYALNPDGTLKWNYTTGAAIYGSPAIGADGTIYVGSYDKKLYALSPDGKFKWSYTTGNYIYYATPAIATDGTIYIGSYDGKLYALSPSGKFKWSYTTGGRIYGSPAIGADGTIYVGSYDKKLYALNPDGSFKWNYTTGSYIYGSPAIGADGTIYIGSRDSKIYALSPDGKFKWSYTTGSWIYGHPAIGADGIIYIGSRDNNVYALNPDGTVKWNYTTGGYIYGSPAIGADGTLYIGSYDGKLYAFNMFVPGADFSADRTEAGVPVTIHFTDLTYGGATAWEWDFNGDGIVDSTEQNPNYTYTSVGNYTVTLNVSNPLGNSTKSSNIVFSALPPVSNFTSSITSGLLPLTVQFTDHSLYATAWAWDFDNDGVIDSTEQNPTYTYQTKGNYTVKLTTTNAFGSDDEIKEGYINVSEFSPASDFTYTSNGSSITITGYVGSGGRVVIPSTIDGLPVVKIDAWVFSSINSITSITIPNSVTTIGPYAFSSCNGLTSIVIPDSVTDLSYFVFSYCSNLKNATLGEGLFAVGSSTFKQCTSLESIIFGSHVTEINMESFLGCSALTSIIIPDTITWIDAYAFHQCSGLTSVTLSKNLNYIGENCFGYCNALTSIIFKGNAPTTVGMFWAERGTVYYYPNATGFTTPTWQGLPCYQVSAPVANFSTSAISGNTPLTVQFTDQSMSATAWAWDFNNDGTIDSTLQNPTWIYDQVGTYTVKLTVSNPFGFGNDEELKTAYINVTPVRADGFSYTGNGTSITIIGYTGSVVDVVIPGEIDGLPVTVIANNAFQGSTTLTSVTIPNCVTSIGNNAFKGCTSLTSVIIGSGVTSIGSSAFSGCTALNSVTLPNNVTSIGSSAFSGCTNMTSVTIGSGVTSISDYAFNGCTALTSVIIPDSVTNIGYYAFQNCAKMTSVTIGSGVTSIGDYAFNGCTALTSVIIPDSVTNIGYYAFQNCAKMTSVTIGSGVTNIGGYAFNGCTALTSVIIPDRMTNIVFYAFNGCTALTSVTIGSGVTSISNNAFFGCTNMTSMVFKGNAPTVGSNWAQGCTNLIVYYYSNATGFTTPTWQGHPCYPILVFNNRSGLIYSTIQAAIDDVNTINGDTITVNGGSYTENVVVNKNLILSALGLVNISALNSSSPVFWVTGSGSGTTIYGFVISGGSCGVCFQDADNCNISNNTIQNNLEGVLIQGDSDNNIIINNVIRNNTWNGVLVLDASSTGNRIVNNTEVSGNDVGIKLYYATLNVVEGNNVTGNDWAGIWLYNATYNTIGNANTVSGNQEGIVLQNNANNNVISGNIVRNNTWNGILIPDATCSGNVISQNTEISGNNIGIDLFYAIGNSVQGNNVTGNDWAGIWVYNGVNNTIADGNTVSNNPEGIFIENSSNIVVSGNSLVNNLRNGVYISNSSLVQVTGNGNISGNQVGVGLASSSNCQISNNTVSGNGWLGVWANNAHDSTIMGNLISANGQEGVLIENGAYNVTVSQNTIRNNIYHGIIVVGVDNNTIDNNTEISGNNIGILLQNASGNLVSSNLVTGSGWIGVCVLDTSLNNQVLSNNITDNPVGVRVDTDSSSNVVNNNSITGSQYGLTYAGTNNTLNATSNWWGSNDDPAVQIQGNVNYTPWITH
nr:leucine-rich repeat protein [uncultured Methanobacterium sp.]